MPIKKKTSKKLVSKTTKRIKKVLEPIIEEPKFVIRNGVKIARLPKHDKELLRGKVTLV